MLKALTLCLYYLQVGNYVSGLPGGQLAKESACNAGDLRSIPGLGRSPGEGNATHANILAWRIPWTVWRISMGSDMAE